MMRTFATVAAITAVLAGTSTEAAQVRVDEFGSGIYGVYLDGEELNGLFDTVIVDIRPDAGFAFANIDEDGADGFSPRPAGEPFTYRSACLGAPLSFCAQGFSVLGATTSPEGIDFTAGPLGTTIDTVNGPNMGPNGLFLANIHLPVGTASANMRLVSAGTIVADLATTFGVPEPSTPLLLCLGLYGLNILRTRERRMMR